MTKATEWSLTKNTFRESTSNQPQCPGRASKTGDLTMGSYSKLQGNRLISNSFYIFQDVIGSKLGDIQLR
jgi:hypothetical protein